MQTIRDNFKILFRTGDDAPAGAGDNVTMWTIDSSSFRANKAGKVAARVGLAGTGSNNAVGDECFCLITETDVKLLLLEGDLSPDAWLETNTVIVQMTDAGWATVFAPARDANGVNRPRLALAVQPGQDATIMVTPDEQPDDAVTVARMGTPYSSIYAPSGAAGLLLINGIFYPYGVTGEGGSFRRHHHALLWGDNGGYATAVRSCHAVPDPPAEAPEGLTIQADFGLSLHPNAVSDGTVGLTVRLAHGQACPGPVWNPDMYRRNSLWLVNSTGLKYRAALRAGPDDTEAGYTGFYWALARKDSVLFHAKWRKPGTPPTYANGLYLATDGGEAQLIARTQDNAVGAGLPGGAVFVKLGRGPHNGDPRNVASHFNAGCQGSNVIFYAEVKYPGSGTGHSTIWYYQNGAATLIAAHGNAIDAATPDIQFGTFLRVEGAAHRFGGINASGQALFRGRLQGAVDNAPRLATGLWVWHNSQRKLVARTGVSAGGVDPGGAGGQLLTFDI